MKMMTNEPAAGVATVVMACRATKKAEELVKREVELTAYIQQAGHDRERERHDRAA